MRGSQFQIGLLESHYRSQVPSLVPAAWIQRGQQQGSGHPLVSLPPRGVSYKGFSSGSTTTRPVTPGEAITCHRLSQCPHYTYSRKCKDGLRGQALSRQDKNRQNVATIFSKWFKKRKREVDLVPLYFSISNLLKPESGNEQRKRRGLWFFSKIGSRRWELM